MSEYKKMITGESYHAADPELITARNNAYLILREYNQMAADRVYERNGVLRQLLGSSKREFHIESPFYASYGFNIFLGENFLAGSNCTFLDSAEITLGNDVILGPNCSLYTNSYPLDMAARMNKFEQAKPITLGNNVWLGGSVVILPGVTLGNNVVVGAGSVVTKSFPDNVVIAGNPAVIIKSI